MSPDSILIPAQGPYAKISLPLHTRLTVIFGPNGSGKTRILDHLAETASDEGTPALFRLSGEPLTPLPIGEPRSEKTSAKIRDALLARVFPARGAPRPSDAAKPARARRVAAPPAPDGETAVSRLADAIARIRPALVLLDLPELLLDADAQRRLLPALLDAFPAVRLVAATHSPHIAASVRDATLVLLAREPAADGAPGPWTARESALHREAMPARDFLLHAAGVDADLPLWAADALREFTERFRALAAGRAAGSDWSRLEADYAASGLARSDLLMADAVMRRIRR